MDIDSLIRFEQLTVQYLIQILDLEQESFTCPWTAEQFELAFQQKSFAVFGLVFQGKLLAYISVYVCDDLEVLNIAVSKAWRKQGLGRALLTQTLHIAKKWGMMQAILEVRVSNTPALNLYKSLGFSLKGRRKAYYPDTGEDALVYGLDFQYV